MGERRILVFADRDRIERSADDCYSACRADDQISYPVEWIGYSGSDGDVAEFDRAEMNRMRESMSLPDTGRKIIIAVTDGDDGHCAMWRYVSPDRDSFLDIIRELSKTVNSTFRMHRSFSVRFGRIMEVLFIIGAVFCAVLGIYFATLAEYEGGLVRILIGAAMCAYAAYWIRTNCVWHGTVPATEEVSRNAILLGSFPGLGLLYMRSYRRGIPYFIAGLSLAVVFIWSAVKVVELKAGLNDEYVDLCITVGVWGLTLWSISLYDTQTLCLERGLDPSSIWASAIDGIELVTMPILLLLIAFLISFLLWDLPYVNICWIPVTVVLVVYYLDKRRKHGSGKL